MREKKVRTNDNLILPDRKNLICFRVIENFRYSRQLIFINKIYIFNNFVNNCIRSLLLKAYCDQKDYLVGTSSIKNRCRRYASWTSLCTALDTPDYSGLSAFTSSPSSTIRIMAAVFYYSHFISTLRVLFIVIARYIVRVTRFLPRCIPCSVYLHPIHLHVKVYSREEFR